MALAYLGLGSNLGDKAKNLNEAFLKLSIEVGKIICQSGFYASKPWGFNSENDFLNAVIGIETAISPTELLKKTQQIEQQLGRKNKPSTGYSDRMIDIDILFYDSLVCDQPNLKIPHPHIANRDFVLIPLSEIAPDLIHPVLNKKMSELVHR